MYGQLRDEHNGSILKVINAQVHLVTAQFKNKFDLFYLMYNCKFNECVCKNGFIVVFIVFLCTESEEILLSPNHSSS